MAAQKDAVEVADVDSAEVTKIINKYSAIAAGVALVPVPGVDLLGLAGVQLKMTHSIGNLYDVKLQDNKVKVAISTLVTTIPANSFAAAGASVLKVVPGIGTALGALTAPAYYAASTYAVGKVFNAHFASGGTLLNFDAEQSKAAYAAYFAEQSKSAKAAK